MSRKTSFPPIVWPDTRLLVLGSLPGEASLRATRYYAHPRNQFWRLIGAAIDRDDLHDLDYDARLVALRHAQVGLWDVVADAERPGSLDGAIRDAKANDLVALISRLPSLAAIGFNGGTAARIGRRLIEGRVSIPMFDLPSSSPAYTLPYAEKRARWLALQYV